MMLILNEYVLSQKKHLIHLKLSLKHCLCLPLVEIINIYSDLTKMNTEGNNNVKPRFSIRE